MVLYTAAADADEGHFRLPKQDTGLLRMQFVPELSLFQGSHSIDGQLMIIRANSGRTKIATTDRFTVL